MTAAAIGPASRVYVAGHGGLVGSAIVRRLQAEGFKQLITASRADVDLTDTRAVDAFFAAARPEYVFLAAARVGGILANSTFPADFIHQNLMLQTNVIDAAYRHGVQKLLFLGSSCIYPRMATQPIQESALLTGPLEPTNEAYAIAKLAGIAMCQAYRRQHGFNAICAMPTNLYGPNDNDDPHDSHVLPALLNKFAEAIEQSRPAVQIWGTGTPRREFLHADDLADALLCLMRKWDSADIVNVGTGADLSILELAALIARLTGFRGSIEHDLSKPDGTPRKCLDVSRMAALGWRPTISLEDGIGQLWRTRYRR